MEIQFEEMMSKRVVKQNIQRCYDLIRENPSNVDARELLVRSLFYLHRFDEAEKEFHELTKVAPERPTAYWVMGNILSKRKRYSEGEQMFRKALELDAHYVPAYVDLGCNLIDQNRVEEGEAEIRKGLVLQPGYWRAHFNLSVVNIIKRRYKESYDHAKRAWLAHKSLLTFVHLVECYDRIHLYWTFALAWGFSLLVMLGSGIVTLPFLVLSVLRISMRAFYQVKSTDPALSIFTLTYLFILLLVFVMRLK